MCGIFFSYSPEDYILPYPMTWDCLKQRGPDHSQILRCRVNGKISRPGFLTFGATVLYLRGDRTVPQPIQDPSTGSVLCWNGEAWKLNGNTIIGNDAEVVFQSLLEVVTDHIRDERAGSPAYENSAKAIITVLTQISGPFTFVFYDAHWSRIFYGRDALGRRSLLTMNVVNDCIMLSSVCGKATDEEVWTEVDSGCIYILEFSNRNLPLGETELLNHEYRPGLDASSPMKNHIQSVWPRQSETLRLSYPKTNKAISKPLSFMLDQQSSLTSLLYLQLYRSLTIRVEGIPTPTSTKGSPRIAILFSGGLDCSVIARVLHDVLPLEHEIDLLNVAFENPRLTKGAGVASPQSPFSVCPDRITGLSTYLELLNVCIGRTWRFVSIDVPYAETLAHRSQVISLIYPHNTEMDLSIALALYFTARGSGVFCDNATGTTTKYTTPARVLFSGLGADELFAGYARHATAFHHHGFQGLVDELELDFSRLGHRNLGRDDRVISHWGREVRYPYIDESLATWALGLPVWEKCGYGEARRDLAFDIAHNEIECIEPGKKLLRLLACKLGMEGAAIKKKRAIQFGARTARMNEGARKGTQRLS